MPDSTDRVVSAFPHRTQRAVTLGARPDEVFAFLDIHDNIAGHMDRPSWAMLGGTMTAKADSLAGKQVGSLITIRGQVLGMTMSLAEQIVQRVPPRSKYWETIGTPRLLIIGGYRMGFDLEPLGDGTRAVVFIEYSLPSAPPLSWLGRLLGPAYARWCVKRVIETAASAFPAAASPHAG